MKGFLYSLIVAATFSHTIPVCAAGPSRDVNRAVFLVAQGDYAALRGSSDFSGCLLRLENAPFLTEEQRLYRPDKGPDASAPPSEAPLKYEFTALPPGTYSLIFTPDIHPHHEVPSVPAMRVDIFDDVIVICEIPALFHIKLSLPLEEAPRFSEFEDVFIEVFDRASQVMAENVRCKRTKAGFSGMFLVGIANKKYDFHVIGYKRGHPRTDLMQAEADLTPSALEGGVLGLQSKPHKPQSHRQE